MPQPYRRLALSEAQWVQASATRRWLALPLKKYWFMEDEYPQRSPKATAQRLDAPSSRGLQGGTDPME
jgi:hypothetical protein